MDKKNYSIIYAEIRPEIAERVSLGIIFFHGSEVSVRYSKKKLDAVKGLVTQDSYKYISQTVRNLASKNTISSEQDVNYLSRYSNNLITVSKLQRIDDINNNIDLNSLYKMYVYAKS